MNRNYPLISSLSTVRQTADAMIKVLNEISEYHGVEELCNMNIIDTHVKNDEYVDCLYNLIDKYTKHMSDLIEAKRIHENIQREIDQKLYSRWKQL